MRPSIKSAIAASALALVSAQAAAQQHRPASDPLHITVGTPEVLRYSDSEKRQHFVCQFSNISSDIVSVVIPVPNVRAPIDEIKHGPILWIDAAKDVIFIGKGNDPDHADWRTALKDDKTKDVWTATGLTTVPPAFGFERLNEFSNIDTLVDFRKACLQQFLKQGPNAREVSPPAAPQLVAKL